MEAVAKGFVRSDSGKFAVQLPDESQFGFSIATDDQAWPGGFGWLANGESWTVVPANDVPAEVRENLRWLLEE